MSARTGSSLYMRALSAAVVLAAALLGIAVLWPYVPVLTIESSGITQLPPKEGDPPGRVTVEIWRWEECDRTVAGTVHGYVDREESRQPQPTDDYPSAPSRTMFPLTSTRILFKEGRHRRAREWDVPAGVVADLPGRWTYRSTAVFCNPFLPFLCTSKPLPPIRIELPMQAPR